MKIILILLILVSTVCTAQQPAKDWTVTVRADTMKVDLPISKNIHWLILGDRLFSISYPSPILKEEDRAKLAEAAEWKKIMDKTDDLIKRLERKRPTKPGKLDLWDFDDIPLPGILNNHL